MTVTDKMPSALTDRALLAATRAPSVHNTQPWRFLITPWAIELHLDRTRVLPVADPGAREARMSCGAALFNLRVALRATGRDVVVALLPDPEQPDLLARVRVGGLVPATPEQRTLAAAIERRTTNRRPFIARVVPASHRKALRRAAKEEKAELVVLDTPKVLGTLSVLLRRAAFLQQADRAFQRELREWTNRDGNLADGVPRYAGTPRPAGGPQLEPGGRPFSENPLVMMLTTRGDMVLDQLRAGMAMQRVLLTATVIGLGSSLTTQPVEVPHTRVAMRTLLGAQGNPQAVLRFGYVDAAARTPRRPVSSVARHSIPTTV